MTIDRWLKSAASLADTAWRATGKAVRFVSVVEITIRSPPGS